MRVSEHYHLGVRQPQLDFVDVALDTDSPLFIDPRALHLVSTEWGRECVALVRDFFLSVLEAITAGDGRRVRSLLGELHEPNETRLGLSRGRSRGRALGPELAVRLASALEQSRAVQTGLLTDLEDTILSLAGQSRPGLPILTNGARLWSQRLADLHFWCQLLGGIGMGAFMGMAGLQGMLRRTIYFDGEYRVFMILAALSGALLAIGLLAFLVNIVMTVGLRGAIGIFGPSRLRQGDLLTPTSGLPARA